MIDERRLYQVLGERLKKLREGSVGIRGRMTQAELAKLVNLERTSITNIEKGEQKVPLHVIFRICEVLKIPVTEVIPSLIEVQSNEEVLLEDINFGGETIKTTPLLKQALNTLLNSGEDDASSTK